MRRIFLLLVMVLAVIFTGACSKDDVRYPLTEDTYTVAVVVPLSTETEDQWRSTVAWALDNIYKAQANCARRVNLDVEMYDEDKEDISSLGVKLAEREDVVAVIGPVDQKKLNDMAASLRRCKKPLFAISAGSTDVVRKYVEKNDFFWAMTQTDISKCEVMISTAAQMGDREFTLVCNNNSFMAQTFKDWFAFQVTELGLKVAGNYLYNSASEIPHLIQKALDTTKGEELAIICVPANVDEALAMMTELEKGMKAFPDDREPRIYFSSNVVQMPIHSSGIDLKFLTVYPFVDPQSGFYTAYYAHTGKTSFTFEAQLYDALMLLSMGLALDLDNLKASLIEITGNDGADLRAWSSEAMSQVFSEIENGGLRHHVTGASSNLMMDVDNHTCVTSSHFMLCYHDGENYLPIAYYSPRHSGQSSSAVADWNWQVTHMDDIDVPTKTFNYPDLHERWAVVVAGSTGFDNYRHQADALNMYQYLRSSGYDDDHIILVIADDIAYDSNNIYPGKISITPDGENLYHDLKIDYKLSDITVQGLLDAIEQIPSDKDDNILIFWTGHGSTRGLVFGEETCTPKMVSAFMDHMQGRYRKMMWLIEACYSGVIGEAIVGYPGAIAMTAANSNETSKADVFNSEMNIWMSNRFTVYLVETQKQTPLTIREMYYYLCVHTLGSHPSLYNYTNYDDITKAGFTEYIP